MPCAPISASPFVTSVNDLPHASGSGIFIPLRAGHRPGTHRHVDVRCDESGRDAGRVERNDVTQFIPLVDAVQPIHDRRAGRTAGRGRSSPTAATTTTSTGGYSASAASPHPSLGAASPTAPASRRQRWVVERSFARLHAFRQLPIRYERRADIRLGLIQLACALICYRPPPPF